MFDSHVGDLQFIHHIFQAFLDFPVIFVNIQSFQFDPLFTVLPFTIFFFLELGVGIFTNFDVIVIYVGS
jgi:hypothetical protein